MKILVFNDYSSEKVLGGSETYTYNLVNLLRSNGHSVKIFKINKTRETFSTFFSRWFSLKHYFQTKRIIREFKPDIIHVNTISRILSPSPIIAAKRLKKLVIMTIHDFRYVCPKTWFIYKDGKPCRYGFSIKCAFTSCYSTKNSKRYKLYHFLKFLNTWLHRFIIKHYVDQFICPSKILTKWFKDNLNISNVSNIPNFIEINNLKYAPIKNYKQFLFVGRLSKEKGVKTLIESLYLVVKKFPKVKLNIVGDGPEKENLIKLAKNNKVYKNINFIGKIPNQKLEKYYKNSAFTIIPSIWIEMFGLVVLESYANGRPVIGSNRGGIPELIKEEETGLIFQAGNHVDLSKKIIYLLEKPFLLNKMCENSITFFKEYFSKIKHLKRLEKEYRKVISNYSD